MSIAIPDADPFVDLYDHRDLLHKKTETGRGYSEKEGYMTRYRFRNGLGASVVHHVSSYDRELAVLVFDAYDPENPWVYDVSYETPITNDVIGYFDYTREGNDRLRKTLDSIAELPPKDRWLAGAHYD